MAATWDTATDRPDLDRHLHRSPRQVQRGRPPQHPLHLLRPDHLVAEHQHLSRSALGPRPGDLRRRSLPHQPARRRVRQGPAGRRSQLLQDHRHAQTLRRPQRPGVRRVTRFNVDPTPHDLWDTYLPAFRATIVEAKAYSIMCAYNAIDNYPACANKMLLETILRGDWGFKGFVTSDCGAVDDFFEANAHHTSPDKDAAAVAGIEAGTDTNCGSTYLALTDAVKKGLITEVRDRRLPQAPLHRPLQAGPLRSATGWIPTPAFRSPKSTRPPITRSPSRPHAKSMVLLKNEQPLCRSKPGRTKPSPSSAQTQPRSPRSRATTTLSRATPSSPSTASSPSSKQPRVLYAQGSPYADGVSLPVPRTLLHPSADSNVEGLRGEYFAADNFDGKPVVTRVDKQIDFDWNSASPVPGARRQGLLRALDRNHHGSRARRLRRHDASRPLLSLRRLRELHRPLRRQDLLAASISEDRRQHGSTALRASPCLRRHQAAPVARRVPHQAPLFGAGYRFNGPPKPEPASRTAVDIAQASRRSPRLRRPLAEPRRRRDANAHRRLLRRRPHRHHAARRAAATLEAAQLPASLWSSS